MKKTHIAFIVVIAVLIGAMTTAINDSSSYADFGEAFENPGEEFHVVGKLNRDRETIYEPIENPDLFVFYMTDVNNGERKVFLHKSKPQDFERSEQIVLIGKADGKDFHANEILMKCPSKYTDGEVTEKAQASF
jgi:cytochrome c-type biogenesis protein CcmE